MKNLGTSARRSMTVAFGVGTTLVVGVAFALWSQTGTGSGSARALDPVTSVVTAGTATADLYPGFAAGDLSFKITNPNPYPVRFTGMTPGTVTSPDPTGCPVSHLSVATKATGLTIDVPANTTTAVERTIIDVVSLASAAPNDCQGKSFTISLTLNGTQQ